MLLASTSEEREVAATHKQGKKMIVAIGGQKIRKRGGRVKEEFF